MLSNTKKLVLIETSIFIFLLTIYIAIKDNYIRILPKCYVYENYNILCPSCGEDVLLIF